MASYERLYTKHFPDAARPKRPPTTTFAMPLCSALNSAALPRHASDEQRATQALVARLQAAVDAASPRPSPAARFVFLSGKLPEHECRT
jgi:hypothetical protein